MHLNFKLSRTQDRFVFSKDTINVLIGPQGEGKTFAAVVALLVYAEEFYQYQKNKWAGNTDMVAPMRGVLIRDSLENIKRHTIPSIYKAAPGVFQVFDDNKLIKGPYCEITAMGLGEGSDFAKLQYGAEYSAGWLEEPAPMVEGGSAGVKRDVFDAMIARCARGSEYRPRIQVTMNPPEESHWTYEEFYSNPRFPNDVAPNVTMTVLHIPYGENKSLTSFQRESNRMAWIKNPALYARFVKGLPALTVIGQAVTPEYQEMDQHGNPWHRTSRQRMLNPVVGIVTYRFWDGGHNPSCVFCQWHPITGQLLVLDVLRGENVGMFQFVEQNVKPLLARRYHKQSQWRDIGDDSIANRDQSNTNYSAARVIETKLRTQFERGEKLWKPRREALKEILAESCITPRGTEAKLLVSWHEQILHRGLSGGWHYRESATGTINEREPVKNIHSHPCDALSYGVERIYKLHHTPIPYERMEKVEMELPLSYAPQ